MKADCEIDKNDMTKLENEVQLILDKRNEVNGIQKDLDVLMQDLNSFVEDNHYLMDAEDEIGCEEADQSMSRNELTDAMYLSDESNPPEINWKLIGPIFQKEIDDLAKLQNLNHLMNSVVKRIRNVTEEPKNAGKS